MAAVHYSEGIHSRISTGNRRSRDLETFVPGLPYHLSSLPGGTRQASSFSSSVKGSNSCAVFPSRETHPTQAQGLLGAGHGGALPSKQQHLRGPGGKLVLNKNVVSCLKRAKDAIPISQGKGDALRSQVLRCCLTTSPVSRPS